MAGGSGRIPAGTDIALSCHGLAAKPVAAAKEASNMPAGRGIGHVAVAQLADRANITVEFKLGALSTGCAKPVALGGDVPDAAFSGREPLAGAGEGRGA